MSEKKTTADIMKDWLCVLKRAAPDAYDNFTVALELYAIEAMDGLTKAPQEAILNMQGRAQQAQAFLRCVRECEPKKSQQQAPNSSAP